MTVKKATAHDIDAWATLRAALWPSTPLEEHKAEIDATLIILAGDRVAFLALGPTVISRSASRKQACGATTSMAAKVLPCCFSKAYTCTRVVEG